MYFGLCVFMCVRWRRGGGAIYIDVYIYIYVYIYIERERERDISIGGSGWVGGVDILFEHVFFSPFFFRTGIGQTIGCPNILHRAKWCFRRYRLGGRQSSPSRSPRRTSNLLISTCPK